MIDLTDKETKTLRELYWKVQEAQAAFQAEGEKVVRAHGADPSKARYNLTPDFKGMMKI